MQPVTYDFSPILQGSDWRVQLQLFQDKEQTVPVDLTGAEIDMHVREQPSADMSEVIIVALSTRLTGEGAGRITFVGGDPTQGNIELQLTSAETKAIKWEGNAKSVPALTIYWYDIELTNVDGTVQRVMRGKWPFDAEITKQA